MTLEYVPCASPRAGTRSQTTIDEALKSSARQGKMATMTETEALSAMNLEGVLDVGIEPIKIRNEFAVSKAGLYVLIHGLLDLRPCFDHSLLQSQLQIRYGLQVDRLSADLVQASLRVFHDAVEQKEPPRVVGTYRSFCINTVPCILRHNQLRSRRYQMHEGVGRAVLTAVSQHSQARQMDQAEADWMGESNQLNRVDDALLDSCRAIGVIQQVDEIGFMGVAGKTYGAAQQIFDQKITLSAVSEPNLVDGFVQQLLDARGTADALVRGLILVSTNRVSSPGCQLMRCVEYHHVQERR